MRVDLPVLMGLSAEDRGRLLTEAAEDQWYERKSLRLAPEVLARSIVGFANAEGGLVVVGLSSGSLEDATTQTRHLNSLRRVPHTHCAPPPRVRFHELDVSIGERQGNVLVASIEPGQTLHETTAGECFLRVGDSTMKLNSAQREELAYDRRASQFEARPIAGVAVSDLDPGHLDALRDALGTTNPDDKLLSARSLLGMRGEVTVAAYLLLAPHPQEQMPHAYVRVLRYLDTAPRTGSRQTLDADGERAIEGPIPQVLTASIEQLHAWVPQRRALRPDGRFAPVPVVPRDAWLEGLVNAVVHRSYSMAGDHIRISIFPDRVEIESPGRFPGLVDPDHPLEINRFARNPRIARVCNDLGFTQEKGEGIRRIFDEMRGSGLVDPVYRQTSGSVRLTLPGAPRISPDVEAHLPTGAAKVLEVLRRAAEPLGTGEISQLIELQRPATLRALRALRDLGEVEWSGKSPKDPRATWTLPRG